MNKMDEVKSAALSLFASKGYAATSMQDIADAVGLNKASIYFYVKSKKELYLLIVDEQLSLLRTAIQEIFDANIDEPIDVLLFEAFKTIVFRPNIEWLLLWKRMHLKVVSSLDDNLIQPLRDILLSNNQSIRDFINEFISAKKLIVDEDVIARFVIAYEAFIQGVFDWRLLNTDADFDTVVPIIWSLFWNGSRFD